MIPLMGRSTYRQSLVLADLTDPATGPHAMQSMLGDVVGALREAWRCPAIVRRASPLISLEENYARLHYPVDGAAADARYTRYLDASTVLRTQMSALIPGLLHEIAPADIDDVLLVCPGLVYRRDRIDWRSTGEPHQLDLWRVASKPFGRPALEEMIGIVLNAAAPGRESRLNPVQHPYTIDGLEIEVRDGDRWLEVGECGLALPAILREASLPTHVSGLAMGLGLDRLLMLRKGIDDIRLLRATDARISSQMRDLEPYRPVSSMPPIRRDLSVAVGSGITAEDLGDRVRDALGADATAVEEVAILSDEPIDDLPMAARARLGARPGQRNLLVRVVLRHPEHTLKDSEANRLRNEIYVAIHEGEVMSIAED